METTIVYGHNGKESGNYYGIFGLLEKKMETHIVYWGCMGIMEHQMETTI